MTVEATTETGTLEMDEPINGECVSCRKLRDVIPIKVKHPDRVDWLLFCGTCIAGALSARLFANEIRAENARIAERIR